MKANKQEGNVLKNQETGKTNLAQRPLALDELLFTSSMDFSSKE